MRLRSVQLSEPRSWSCGWKESGAKPRKRNHNSKIAEEKEGAEERGGGSVGGGAAQEGGVVAQERGQAPSGEFRLGAVHFQRHRFRQRRGHDSLIGETVAGQAFGGLLVLG